MKQWRLYKKVLSKELNVIEYIWLNPLDEVIYNRVIVPLGVVGFVTTFQTGDLMGFKKVKTKMTQEELSKGWLIL